MFNSSILLTKCLLLQISTFNCHWLCLLPYACLQYIPSRSRYNWIYSGTLFKVNFLEMISWHPECKCPRAMLLPIFLEFSLNIHWARSRYVIYKYLIIFKSLTWLRDFCASSIPQRCASLYREKWRQIVPDLMISSIITFNVLNNIRMTARVFKARGFWKTEHLFGFGPVQWWRIYRLWAWDHYWHFIFYF